MNACLKTDFMDCSTALRIVFLAQHRFVNKIYVISCAGTALFATTRTAVNRLSNP